MEEIRAFEEIENTEVVEVNEEPETSGNGILGVIAGGLVIAAGATAVVLHKTKSKREAKKIEKLRKKGYVVIAPEEVDEIEANSNDDVENVEEESK